MGGYLKRICLAIILTIVLVLTCAIPAMAQDDGYVKILEPFTVDKSQPGNLVDIGATIHHLANGVTEVYKADKSLKLKALESDASLIPTPNGLMKANRLYRVPNGAEIVTEGNVIKILSEGVLILTILDDTQKQIAAPAGGWIEKAEDMSVSSLEWWDASWTVPSRPSHNGANDSNYAYYFTGLQTDKIIQPVLQWNQAQNHKWTIQSWDYFANGSAVGPSVDVSEGDPIRGQMSYNSNSSQWTISIWKDGSTSKSSIAISDMGNLNLQAYCALEAGDIEHDDDLPGSCYFKSMTFKGSGSDITWVGVPPPPDQFGFLNDMGVGCDADPSHVELFTHNLSVVTQSATGITNTTATLNGNLDRLGNAANAAVSFQYGLTTSYGSTKAGVPSPLTAPGAFSAGLTGLTSGKTYHFRAKAVSSLGTSYGADQTFTATSTSLVTVTDPATFVTTNSATLNGKVTSMGNNNSVTVSFQYGLTTSYGSTVAGVPSSLTAPGTFTANITGLTPNKTYHYRTKAVGSSTKYGNDQTFTTSPIPPVVTTNPASSITATAATLNANLSSLGSASSVTVDFVWDLTGDWRYDNTVAGVPPTLTAPGTFTARITGLTPNTTYHFRARAQGSGIMTFGNDQTFTTLPPSDRWTATEGYLYSLTSDGSYTYAGLSLSPAVVVKIDPSTMTEVSRWTDSTAEGYVQALTSDGTYVYADLQTNPAKVVKINPSTMTEVSRWTDSTAENYAYTLTSDGSFVYASIAVTYPSRAIVVKINPSAMTEVSRWTDSTAEGPSHHLTSDGIYIYASISIGTPNSIVVKIDPSTMTQVRRWIGVTGGPVDALASDGSYVYASLSSSPAIVVKVDPSTMTEVSRWTDSSAEGIAFGLTSTSGYVYASPQVNPATVVKIDPSTMTEVSRWTDSTAEGDGYPLTSDSSYVYVGFDGRWPATVIRISR
jgi:hypothetical protein